MLSEKTSEVRFKQAIEKQRTVYKPNRTSRSRARTTEVHGRSGALPEFGLAPAAAGITVSAHSFQRNERDYSCEVAEWSPSPRMNAAATSSQSFGGRAARAHGEERLLLQVDKREAH